MQTSYRKYVWNFRRPIIAAKKLVINVAIAAVVLHNNLMMSKNFNSSYQYCPLEMVDQETVSSDVTQDSLGIFNL